MYQDKESGMDENIKTLSKERFGRYAAGYVQSTDHANADELANLVSLVQPAASWQMLDVATGGGHTALAFAPYVAGVIASDVTPQMLAQAEIHIKGQNITNVRYELVDAMHMVFDAGAFDLVTCRIAAHHFSDAGLFVQEAARVLKPGGLFLVQDQAMPEDGLAARYIEAFEKLRDPSHNRAFSQSEWAGMFSMAGFTVTHVEKIRRHHLFLQWAERQKVTPSTIDSLIALALSAPPEVQSWMQPRFMGTPEAEFYSDHIIILGKKRPL